MSQHLLRTAQWHLKQNQLLEAAKCFFEVTRQQPDCFEAYCQLGLILHQLKQPTEALACLQAAARLQPKYPKLNMLQAAILKEQGRFAEAANFCQRELELQPADADAHYNYGLVLQNLNRLEEALGAYQRALELRPGYLDALMNQGAILRQQLQTEAARRCFEEAVRRDPQNPAAHWELCTVLLALGQFERGWKEYEWRWKLKDFNTPPARFAQPHWDGSDLKGRRILLHCEQGYGDTIQFARFAAVLAGRGATVLLGCPPPLRPLLETAPGVSQVVTRSTELPPFDVHCPLLSLPALLHLTLETIPADVPYLQAPAQGLAAVESTAHRSLRVGLVWAGDPKHRNDARRSLPLEFIRPLLAVPGIEWFSLQAGPRAEDLNRLNLASQIADLGSRFRDFGDTAQALCQLDLVISVDTGVAHAAGALGRRVWTLLPFEAEWRWLLHREDSPWYPTMRLFRQSAPGNWSGVVERVALELNKVNSGR